jgi:3-phosphoshikimate 1-carboxyvinyltransferase
MEERRRAVNEPPCLVPPVSKSDAQRALVLAHVLKADRSQLFQSVGVLPHDVDIVQRGLAQLSFPTALIDCEDGGAPFRFLLTQAALTPGTFSTFLGTQRLSERPQTPLVTALRQALQPHGLKMDDKVKWPLEIQAVDALPLSAHFSIDASQSSQFASSLLLGAAKLVMHSPHPSSVTLTGSTASQGYLDMTLAAMREVGFRVEVKGNVVEVLSVEPRPPQPVPGDWSSLTYLLLLSWKTGARVSGLSLKAQHPDARFYSLLNSIGINVLIEASAVSVSGRLQHEIDVDAEAFPDAMPSVAALACVAPHLTRIRNTQILTVKESDRLEGIERMVSAVGGTTLREGQTLQITAPSIARPMVFDARNDHRLAMAAAVTAALSEVSLRLRGRDCVKKSFPQFWLEYQKVAPLPQFEDEADLTHV